MQPLSCFRCSWSSPSVSPCPSQWRPSYPPRSLDQLASPGDDPMSDGQLSHLTATGRDPGSQRGLDSCEASPCYCSFLMSPWSQHIHHHHLRWGVGPSWLFEVDPKGFQQLLRCRYWNYCCFLVTTARTGDFFCKVWKHSFRSLGRYPGSSLHKGLIAFCPSCFLGPSVSLETSS